MIDVLRFRAATVCLLALSVVLLGLCPLAPAMAAAPVHVPPCHSKVPASGPHSCCIVVHHQPALIRPALENNFALTAPPMIVSSRMERAQSLSVTASNNTPSPPFLCPALRI
ncbi:MAG TPA: hypothetical protein VKR26_18220 [Terriglobales bacterium]|nr:hypothetical protein [Terriglobales bacterium]